MVWRWKADGRSTALEGLKIEVSVEGGRNACKESVISSGGLARGRNYSGTYLPSQPDFPEELEVADGNEGL